MLQTSFGILRQASIAPAYNQNIVRCYAISKYKIKPVDKKPKTKAMTKKLRAKLEAEKVKLDEALKVLKAVEIGYPTHSVDLQITCNLEKGQHQIRGSFIMPHTFKTNGKQAEEARKAGADFVGLGEWIEKIKANELEFDKCLATPDVLPEVAKIARILGPKGLMPTINKGTVVSDVKSAVIYAKNSFDYSSNKMNLVSTGIGKVHFTDEQIEDNIKALINSIREQNKFDKKRFIEKIGISSTQGPEILVDL
ncbi:hypothetical protein BB561_003445 [Smittium simulii]|uniref:Ribosomal protein n=1 Tax=Smittium simulii TaxID=133385 RepID=A0A2T9YLC1_9FUNG|nr:hypothetical protein BB561_003445 [Smittium simulii]